RLGQEDLVARSRRRVAYDAIRMDGARDGHAELGLRIVDRVPAEHGDAGLPGDVGAAAEHVPEQLAAKRLERPGDEVERGQRAAAHRVDVGQRVGRRYAAEV